MRREQREPDSDWSIERLERFEASIESVEAFEAGLAAANASAYRLKTFDTSAREQLAQHQLWLEQYVATEKWDRAEHERRLKQLMRRQERGHKRQRVVQRYKQVALANILFLRLCGLSVRSRVVSVLIYCIKPIFNCTVWTAANVCSFGRLGIEVARGFAQCFTRLIPICLSWSRLKVVSFALSLLDGMSVSVRWTRRGAYDFAVSATKLLWIALFRVRRKVNAFALALFNLASVGYLWMLKKARDLAPCLQRLLSASITEAQGYGRCGLASGVRLVRRAGVGVQQGRRSKAPTRPNLSPDGPSTPAEEWADVTTKPASLFRPLQLPKSTSAQIVRARANRLLDGAVKRGSNWAVGCVGVLILLIGSSTLLFTRYIAPVGLEEHTPNLPGPADARLTLTTGQTAEPIKRAKPSPELSDMRGPSRESPQQIAALDTLRQSAASAKGSGHHDEDFHKSHAIDPRLASPPGASLPKERLPEIVTQSTDEAAREGFADISPAHNEQASANPLAGTVATEDAEVSSLISQSVPSHGGFLLAKQPPETVTQSAAVVPREDLTFCGKWAKRGQIVCRREDGTAIVVGPANIFILANARASAEPSADSALLPKDPASEPGPSISEERLPESITQNPAETAGAREDLSFCRKWIGLGRIVCRRKNGTAVEVGAADISTLAEDGASARRTAGVVAPKAAHVAASPSLAEFHRGNAAENDNGRIRFGIELGSASHQADLMQLWRQFLTSHVALAVGLQPKQVLTRDNDWRLIAGPFAHLSEARGACEVLKKAFEPCRVSLYAGDRR